MFCTNCGQKLDTGGINFCPYCGNEIIFKENKNIEELHSQEQTELQLSEDDSLVETLQKQVVRKRVMEPLVDIQWENESVYDEDIYHLFWKHMGRPSQYGEKVILTGPDQKESDIERAFCKNLDISRPIMIFDYGSFDEYGFTEGIVLNCQEILYCIEGKLGRIPLCEIANVVFVKRVLLVPAMVFRLKSEEISDDIYLTGIRNVEEFVDRFRKFIFELNHIGCEEESTSLQDDENEQRKIGEQDVISQKINLELGRICNDNSFRSDYCDFGNPISLKNSFRLAQAMEYFKIDSQERTYMICDSSMSGKNCTEGFALCTGGFRFRYDKQSGVILWEHFADVQIKKFINCVKVDGMIFSSAFETKKILSILWQIQNSIKEIYK